MSKAERFAQMASEAKKVSPVTHGLADKIRWWHPHGKYKASWRDPNSRKHKYFKTLQEANDAVTKNPGEEIHFFAGTDYYYDNPFNMTKSYLLRGEGFNAIIRGKGVDITDELTRLRISSLQIDCRDADENERVSGVIGLRQTFDEELEERADNVAINQFDHIYIRYADKAIKIGGPYGDVTDTRITDCLLDRNNVDIDLTQQRYTAYLRNLHFYWTYQRCVQWGSSGIDEIWVTLEQFSASSSQIATEAFFKTDGWLRGGIIRDGWVENNRETNNGGCFDLSAQMTGPIVLANLTLSKGGSSGDIVKLQGGGELVAAALRLSAASGNYGIHIVNGSALLDQRCKAVTGCTLYLVDSGQSVKVENMDGVYYKRPDGMIYELYLNPYASPISTDYVFNQRLRWIKYPDVVLFSIDPTDGPRFEVDLHMGSKGSGRKIILHATDEVDEGGEFELEGAASYPSWYLDNKAGQVRFYTGGSSYLTLSTTQLILAVAELILNGSAKTLKDNSGVLELNPDSDFSAVRIFNPLQVNTINERTLDAGITIDSVLLKDNTVKAIAYKDVNGDQVVGTRQSTFTVPSIMSTMTVAGEDQDGVARTKINDAITKINELRQAISSIKSILDTHGLSG